MITFTGLLSQTTQLFHSENIVELFTCEDPLDFLDLLEQAGLSHQDVEGLSTKQVEALLLAGGVDLSGHDLSLLRGG